jgi:hypothetical protein
MRVGLNLAIPPRAGERYALYWAIPATLLGIAGLVFLVLFTVRSFREHKVVQKSLTEHEAQENALHAQEMALRNKLEEPAARQLLNDAKFVNGLIEERRFSMVDMISDLTSLMPDEVRLSGLTVAPQGQEVAVRFVIAGKSEEAIEAFLSSLEDSSQFKDVAIVNQGFEQEGSGSELENIACTATYLPGQNQDSESSGE